MASTPHIHSLHAYPVKSCAGISPSQVRLSATGLPHDREWMLVDPNGRFITQRDDPRLALVATAIRDERLWLSAPGLGSVAVGLDHLGTLREVGVWDSRCPAFDAGDAAAEFFSALLGRATRLVRFDPAHQRLSNREWTAEIQAPNLFSDGYPLLILSLASLQDLNYRIGRELPMNRFRPNIVLGGVPAYAEDRIREIAVAGLQLRLTKPCTRCVITTTDQATGRRDGEEPLRTLTGYRYDPVLRGVTFGRNAVIVRGVGEVLRPGQEISLY